MSADACVAFYGIRFEVGCDEFEGLETRSDARVIAAQRNGLKHFWANFAAPGERYLLFVGTQLAMLGPEDLSELVLPSRDLEAMAKSTKAKLQAAGLYGEPSLYVQWLADA